ncbi:LOW QUALITY PROTEIN: mitochondrial ribosome-associated GTPase 2 [Atheta coriaria]|uniref:LOW QUALITY PROTEIN: mitochondrial ribosome-associated GTPase 2 n=1 Tax=Dalotia coriaria TaxID=877792 RepID=UPI0031F474DD
MNTMLNCSKRLYCQRVAQALRSRKSRSQKEQVQRFIDFKRIKTQGGSGGNGCISFLHLWSNDKAGPDGGNGGNGGHVILKATHSIKDLNHVNTVIKGTDGVKGSNKDCDGECADHLIVNVPVGTIIKNKDGTIIGDLDKEEVMFVAARGGAGGKGNHFFTTDTEQSPEICEYGAQGEIMEYTLELRSMAHMGLIGFPNAGKSTLLRAISRAKPKIAPYPFTTLKPHIGVVQYEDYEQLAVADLPGLIPDSHKNKGLGIQFLKHAERCSGLLFIIDISTPQPLEQLATLQYELKSFSSDLIQRPQLIVANKIDLPGAEDNYHELKENTALEVIPISAKVGTNVGLLLQRLRQMYDNEKYSK